MVKPRPNLMVWRPRFLTDAAAERKKEANYDATGTHPIELYEGAVHYMRPILAGVTPNQLGNATPCSEWNVQQLITHNIKVTGFALEMLQANITVPEAAMDVSGDIPAEGAENAFVTGANRVLDFFEGRRRLK